MKIDKLTVSSGAELEFVLTAWMSWSSVREADVSAEVYSMLSQFGGQLTLSGVARDAIWDPSTSESQEGAELKVEEVKDVEKWHIQQNESCHAGTVGLVSETGALLTLLDFSSSLSQT